MLATRLVDGVETLDSDVDEASASMGREQPTGERRVSSIRVRPPINAEPRQRRVCPYVEVASATRAAQGRERASDATNHLTERTTV